MKLKVFFLSLLLTFSIAVPSNEVFAQSKSKRIQNQVQTLKQSAKRWILVDISNQALTAWEGSNPVYAVKVSTGKKKTPTLIGAFNVQTKHRKTRMRGADYDVPNVPYVMYYHGGYGIHGAYWHRSFGTPVSHGCVNVAPNHAKWLYDWAIVGTPVIVQK
jgi:lipoprotein-anchoring transpeptidase ErfK/SrfK